MKQIHTLITIITIGIFISCDVNVSVNKNFITGESSKGDGLGCSEVIVKASGEEVNRNDFVQGEKVEFIFNEISGLNKKENKVYVGMSLCVLKNDTDTVAYLPDVAKDFGNGLDKDPVVLTSYFVADLPYKNKEEYSIKINIWDKIGEGTFTYEFPFTVKANPLLKIEDKGLAYSKIYLWNETKKQVLFKKEVSLDDRLILILDKLDGFDVIDEKIYPSLAISITDNDGNAIISSDNILGEHSMNGLSYEGIKNGQIPIEITFEKGDVSNPCQIKSSLIDLKSGRRIDIEGKLEIR